MNVKVEDAKVISVNYRHFSSFTNFASIDRLILEYWVLLELLVEVSIL